MKEIVVEEQDSEKVGNEGKETMLSKRDKATPYPQMLGTNFEQNCQKARRSHFASRHTAISTKAGESSTNKEICHVIMKSPTNIVM